MINVFGYIYEFETPNGHVACDTACVRVDVSACVYIHLNPLRNLVPKLPPPDRQSLKTKV